MSFTFKKFAIEDVHCAMKVGTDAVLLGAWANINEIQTICDVGTGSGVISLILAQRLSEESPDAFPQCSILGVEIDEDAFGDYTANVNNSIWKDKFKGINADFKEIRGTFDLIISNPPFFAESLKSPSRKRTLARQGDTLSYQSLIRFAVTHLNSGGRLCFISDYNSMNDIEYHIMLNKLFLQRRCIVHSNSSSLPKRVLWEVGREECHSVDRTSLYIYEDRQFSAEYINLTKRFYLNF